MASPPGPTVLHPDATTTAHADRLAATYTPFASDTANDTVPFSTVRSLELGCTDLFAGAGGLSLGAVWAGAVPVQGLNHWPTAIGTFRANHGADTGVLVDLQHTSSWAHPATRALLASPDMPGHLHAAGRHRPETLQARARSRATARAVAEFAEAHGYLARGDDGYQLIVVENVVEFRDWTHLRPWLADLAQSGYRPSFVTVDAAHLGAAAHRERAWIVLTRIDRPLPDLTLRTWAACDRHGHIRAVQHRRSNRYLGRYGHDYQWVCPTCDQPVRPDTGHARNVIDGTLPAPTMHERDTGHARPLTPGTIARIRAGIDRHGHQPLVVLGTRTGQPARGVTTLDQALPTITTQQEIALWDPGDGTWSGSTYRYLTVAELAAATGFPPGYHLDGRAVRDRVRQIGQAVSPHVARLLVARAAATLEP